MGTKKDQAGSFPGRKTTTSTAVTSGDSR